MELLNIEEHLNCFNYDHSAKPIIEVIEYAKGEKTESIKVNTNEVVFFLKGRVKYTFHNFPECQARTGKMLFMPMGYRYVYNVESAATIVIFRLSNPVKLCEGFFVEHLFESKKREHVKRFKNLKMLEINEQIMYFVEGLTRCVKDGMKCKHYFDLKIKEFFMLLRAYYTKSELRGFLDFILSHDIAFSEYVRSNRNRYSTVIAFAESMHMTQKQFAKRFRKVFGRTPYGWMKEGRVLAAQSEIIATKKSIKQIAIETGFNTSVQFTKFCKKELGMTPMELRSKQGEPLD